MEPAVRDVPPRHRLRRILTLAGVTAGAFVIGARAGRGRYEQIRATTSKAVRAARATLDGARTRADDVVDDVRIVSNRVSQASQVAGETAAALVEGPASEQTEQGVPR